MIIFKNKNTKNYITCVNISTPWYACPNISTLIDKINLKGKEKLQWRQEQQAKCNIVDCFDGSFQCPGPNQILDSATRQIGIYDNKITSSKFLESIGITSVPFSKTSIPNLFGITISV